MTTKPKLLKPKAQANSSHNTGLQSLVDAVKKSPEVPLQVRLSEDLATRVKVYCAKNKLTHKQLITSALERFLPEEK